MLIKLLQFLNKNLSFWLISAKACNFGFITLTVLLLSNEYEIAQNVIKGGAFAGLVLIFLGPIFHHLSMQNRCGLVISTNISLIVGCLIFSYPLSENSVVFLALTTNILGKTILDTIFINHHLVITRAKIGVLTDIGRLTFVFCGFFDALIFLVPLAIETLLITSKRSVLATPTKSLYFPDLINDVFPGAIWWVFTQRVPSLVFLFHLDRLQEASIYSYCIILATQISGALETLLSPIWFRCVSNLKKYKSFYSDELSRVAIVSFGLGTLSLIFATMVDQMKFTVGTQLVDAAAVVAIAICGFSARFATLNINHLALYSEGRWIFNVILIFNSTVFAGMYLVDSLSWATFCIPFLITSAVITLFRRKLFMFAYKSS